MAEREKPQEENEDEFSPEAIQKKWDEWCRLPEEVRNRICLNCANLVWPKRFWSEGQTTGWSMLYPVCVDHVDSPGEPREVHPGDTCPNFRAKAKPALRVEPPEPPTPDIKHIPLTRGMWAIVDAADFERLNKYRWYASPSGGGKIYARRNTKNGTVLMHREVIHAPDGMVVDHKNRNTVDNRADNLRACTPAQNEYNKAPRGKKSRFKGVYPDGDKWYAVIKHQGVTYYLGTFDDEVEAAKARDRKAYELEGEYAYLNFPDEILGKGPKESNPKDASGPEH